MSAFDPLRTLGPPTGHAGQMTGSSNVQTTIDQLGPRSIHMMIAFRTSWSCLAIVVLLVGASGQAYAASMALASEFRSPFFGREQLCAGAKIPRHQHRDGYITVVLSGGYQEAGFDGRRNLAEGNVVVHRRYDAHLDTIASRGAALINLPLPSAFSLPSAFQIDDPDAIARIAEDDPFEAAFCLQPKEEILSATDWSDLLAQALIRRTNQRLDDWAHEIGLAVETLSRGFRSAYGVAPARFRAEARARQAMIMIERAELSLAAIAVECGYFDQSHLSRAIVALTGRPPGHWRRSSPYNNGRRKSA
jgi:AraC-like DNA-binding protein